MSFLNRSQKKLYKSYKDCSVEYHAGGFFVRKVAIYLYIQSNDTLVILEKNEGLHPFDNEYSKLLSEDIKKGITFKISDLNNNLIMSYDHNNIGVFSDGVNEIKVMPSVFLESFSDTNVTEILIDFGNDFQNIFFLVYDTSKSLEK